jgi:HEAT repeat protein
MNSAITVAATAAMSSTSISPIEPTPVDRAFAALESYSHGSPRGPLMPLDDAVKASLVETGARSGLEERLIAALERRPSPVATDYICGKLALIGSQTAVPVLAALLEDPQRVEPARNALEALPCVEAIDALRASLSRLEGMSRLGVILSLGVRRDVGSVAYLRRALWSSDTELARSAAAALGEIGDATGAAALVEALPKVPEVVRKVVADACLVCAGRLAAAGQMKEARRVYHAIESADVSIAVRAAAGRGLARFGRSS